MNEPPLIDVSTITQNKSLEVLLKKVVDAQRKADIAYYEPLLRKSYQTGEGDAALVWSAKYVDLAEECTDKIQQAKKSGAKEVVDWIEENCIGVNSPTDDPEDYIGIQSIAWQDFKKKYEME